MESPCSEVLATGLHNQQDESDAHSHKLYLPSPIFIISSRIHLDFSSTLFSSSCWTEILQAFPTGSMWATSHLILLDLFILIISSNEY